MGRAFRLTAMGVKKASDPGMYADGAGLWLRVSPGGAKYWIFRFLLAGKDRWMGLGAYPTISLEEARDLAISARKKVKAGTDPIDERQAEATARKVAKARSKTFGECVDAFIDAKQAEWTNPKHAAQWRNTLAIYAASLTDLPVSEVDLPAVLNVLQLDSLWTAKPETASRLRGRIENVLDWATVRGYHSGDNPARWRGHLDKVLASAAKLKDVQHHPALPYREIGPFMAELAKHPGMSARALEFAILTATRSGDVRGATWGELDRTNRLWTVPKERMKAKREHRVPLSDAAWALLETVRPEGEAVTDMLVFPSPRGLKLSDMAFSALLRRVERADLTAHGFRSTFRDWTAEQTNYPHEMAELALAHTIGDKVEAAYRCGDMLEKRRRMMDDWARRCHQVEGTPGNVTPIRAGETGSWHG